LAKKPAFRQKRKKSAPEGEGGRGLAKLPRGGPQEKKKEATAQDLPARKKENKPDPGSSEEERREEKEKKTDGRCPASARAGGGKGGKGGPLIKSLSKEKKKSLSGEKGRGFEALIPIFGNPNTPPPPPTPTPQKKPKPRIPRPGLKKRGSKVEGGLRIIVSPARTARGGGGKKRCQHERG